MPQLKSATDAVGSTWANVPDGTWRWVVQEMNVVKGEYKGKERWSVRFPLMLTEAEQARLKDEHGEPPEDTMQSYRAFYRCGLSLGFFRSGQYQTTRLADFLVTLFGVKQQKDLRRWIQDGGAPIGAPAWAECDDCASEDVHVQHEIGALNAWFKWFEGAEVYGTVENVEENGRVWCNFGGPLALGSQPGPAEPDYQAWGRGKLRQMLADVKPDMERVPESEPVAVGAGAGGQLTPEQQAKYESMFGADEGAEA